MRTPLAALTVVVILAVASPAQAAFLGMVNGSTANLTDQPGASSNFAVYVSDGLLAHTLTEGFNSPIDWDTTAPGDQTVADGAASRINIDTADGDDGISIGREPRPDFSIAGSWAGAIDATIAFDGGDGTDLMAVDNAGDAAPRAYAIGTDGVDGAAPGAFGWAETEEVRVLAGAGADVVDVSGAPLQVTLYAGAGDDRLRFADGSVLGGSGIADGGPGRDTIDYGAFTSPVGANLGAQTAFVAEMSGIEEVPGPAITPASGTVVMAFDGTSRATDLDTVSRHLEVSRMTGAFLHVAPPGMAGPVIVNLDRFAFRMLGDLMARRTGFTFPEEQAPQLLAGNVYVNLHTSTYPAGEIRGQLGAAGQAGLATGMAWQARFEDVRGGSVRDILVGGDAANELRGGDGDDLLVGRGGDDTLIGRADDDLLLGEEGNDLLLPGLGRDTADGGAGADTLSYEERTTAVAVTLDGSRNEGLDPDGNGVSAPDEEGDLDVAVEHARGGSGPDRLVGGRVANRLAGGAGGDVLDGRGGGDTFDGGSGADTATYVSRSGRIVFRMDGLRNDGADPDGSLVSTEEGDRDRSIENVIGSQAGDWLFGSDGANVLSGAGGDDTIQPGLGRDRAVGGGGTDMLDYADRETRVAVSLDGAANDGADPDGSGASSAAEEGDQDASIESARGGPGNDVLAATIADAIVNRLFGRNGNDVIRLRDGTATADVARCGAGSDTFDIDPSDTAPDHDCETAAPLGAPAAR